MKPKPKRVAWPRFAPLVGLLAVHIALASVEAAEDDSLHAVAHDPRAYGWRVGDVAHRSISIHAPAGLQLDPTSLPRAGMPGQAIELRSLNWRRDNDGPGSRYELDLDYQVFQSPAEVLTFEMPPLLLRFTGRETPQDLRIEAWPITVSPLVPVEVSPRTGLGEMQPDAPPPRVDTRVAMKRLAALTAVAGVLLLYLTSVYVGVPWWGRRHRPFHMAWRRLRGRPREAGIDGYREACREVHAALNVVAGEVMFAAGIDRFIARRPAYGAVRDDLMRFFERSRQAFFADDVNGVYMNADRAAVIDLCRRCRDIERGSA